MKYLNPIFLALFIYAFGIFNVNAQSFSTQGKDFWLGYMENLSSPAPTLDLYLSSNKATSGTVSVPLAGWSTNYTVTPGVVTHVLVPTTYMTSGSETVQSKGVHVVANDSISLYSMNYRSYSADGALILPTPTLGDDYYVLAIEGYSTSSYPSECLIIATQNNTTVEVTPSVKTKGGKAAGSPFTVTLQQGEVYPINASSNYDLTGTKIRSYGGAPIAVYGGGMCAKVGGCSYCDHIYEQMYPISTWGTDFILIPLKTRKEDVYRIIASENGTSVTINGTSTLMLNAGQYYEFKVKQTAETVTASCPISMAQYTEGLSCDNVGGDPDIIMLSPNEQTLTDATIVEVGTGLVTNFYINVMTKTANTSLVKLDGTSIASSFSTVAADPTYSYAQITTDSGAHVLKTDSGFIAYVYGFGATGVAESYGYAAGASLKNLTSFNIISKGDSIDYSLFNDTICPGEGINFTGNSTSNILSWVWYYGDGDSTIGKTASHTYLVEGVYDLKLVYEKNNGCSISTDTLSAKLTVKGPSITFNSVDETCSQANGLAIAYISDTTVQANYVWSTNPVQTNDTASGLSAGDYWVTITYGTCSAIDTVTINNLTSFTIQMDSVNETCSLANGKAYVTPNILGTYTYSWNTSPIQTTDTASNLVAGTYIVSVDDGTCLVTDSISIVNYAAPVVVLSSIDETCNLPNGSAIASIDTGNSAYTLSWNTNPVQTTDTASLLSSGYYVLTVIDSLCTVIDSVMVNAEPVLVTSNFSFDQELNNNGKTNANFSNLTIGADSVHWDFGDGTSSTEKNPTHSYSDTGVYAVTLISYDPNGCADTLLQYIIIQEPYSFYIPNSFTPDNDGLNDSFSGKGIGIYLYAMNIRDRWGNLIFETADINQPWYGQMQSNNMLVQDGVYIYTFNIVSVLGDFYTYRGSVALIR